MTDARRPADEAAAPGPVPRPRVAIYKFSSCSGCQQSFLNAEPYLMDIFKAIDIVYFYEGKRDNLPGPYDVAIVEGSISTPEELEIVRRLRKETKFLMPIGDCAVYGGPQAQRNFRSMDDLITASYPEPQHLDVLPETNGIDAHVLVDYRVYGCGPNPRQLVDAIAALLQGREPNLPRYSVCVDCKMKGNICVLVAGQIACMGPVTVAGCEAACPSHNRGCYGCFGPMSAPNTRALGTAFNILGYSDEDISRMYRRHNSNSPAFKEASTFYAKRAESRLHREGRGGRAA